VLLISTALRIYQTIQPVKKCMDFTAFSDKTAGHSTFATPHGPSSPVAID